MRNIEKQAAITYPELSKLEEHVAGGLILKRKHPEFNLWIYNYSREVMYGRLWDETTMICRGLILNREGCIKARPFRKFFNLGEYEDDRAYGKIPSLPFKVFEKIDGSLGIQYRGDDGKNYIATRGSFESDQANAANKILQEKYSYYKFIRAITYLFEIIHPDYPIVVNYGDRKDLILLAIIMLDSGVEIINLKSFDRSIPFPLPKTYDGIRDYRKLVNIHRDNEEGFVIQFTDDSRLKIKMDEYIRLHRLITGMSKRRVWEMMRDGKQLEEIITKDTPEEFQEWGRKCFDDLLAQFDRIKGQAFGDYLDINAIAKNKSLVTRKDLAMEILKKDNPSMLFAMLDGRPYDDNIWKLIKPPPETFRRDG